MKDREWNENDWHEWRGRMEAISSQQTDILKEIKDWLKSHAQDEMEFQSNMQSHISAAAESRAAMETRFNKLDDEMGDLKEDHKTLRENVATIGGQIKNFKVVISVLLGIGLALGGAMANHLLNWNEKVHALVDQKIEQQYRNGTNGSDGE